MKRWEVTGYRLSQTSGIDRSTIAKLLRGDLQTATWDKVEKLANGFERIDPIAKDAFIGALERPDSTYPHITDNTIAIFWESESSDNIAAVMKVLEKYKLLDQEALKKLKTKLAQNDVETEAIIPTTIEDFIGSRMLQERREKEDV